MVYHRYKPFKTLDFATNCIVILRAVQYVVSAVVSLFRAEFALAGHRVGDPNSRHFDGVEIFVPD